MLEHMKKDNQGELSDNEEPTDETVSETSKFIIPEKFVAPQKPEPEDQQHTYSFK
jgi:hypothetical protein